MWERAVCSRKRNPSVVMTPTRAPLPSRIAFVATVVPCRRFVIRSASMPAWPQIRSMPASTPSDESLGVDGTFARQVRPLLSSMSSRSVNVPPTSTPSR